MSGLVKMDEKTKVIERALIDGDLSGLSTGERMDFYMKTCQSMGLNHLTRPFGYIKLNNKLQLYAFKDCTDQLRKLNKVSIKITNRELIEGVYIVSAAAKDSTGREDESTGAVTIDGLKGEARANAMLKAETKAKRRVTLSICGLGMLDESEVETIPNAEIVATPAVLPPKAVGSTQAATQSVESGNGDGPQISDGGPPVCCGQPMRESKFVDKQFGHKPWWCPNCNNKAAKQ